MVGWEYCGGCELTMLAGLTLPTAISLYILICRYLTNYPPQLGDSTQHSTRKYCKLIFVRRLGREGGRGEGGSFSKLAEVRRGGGC